MTLACLYLPYAWILAIDRPWDDYQWHWLRIWPILPGIGALAFLSPHNMALVYGGMALLTVAFCSTILFCALRCKRWHTLLALLVLTFGLSCANSWLAYGVYHL